MDQFNLSFAMKKTNSTSGSRPVRRGSLKSVKGVCLSAACFIFLILNHTLSAQNIPEIEELTQAEEKPFYILNLKLKYSQNEEETEETNYPTDYEKRTEQLLNGNLRLMALRLGGEYRLYDFNSSVGDYRIELRRKQFSIGAQVNLPLFYIWGSQRNQQYTDAYDYLNVTTFRESEQVDTQSLGIGIHLGNLRLGLATNSLIRWAYDVAIADQNVISEDVRFKVNMFEFARTPVEIKGLHFLFAYRTWTDSEFMDGRSGDNDGQEISLLIGFGFGEDSLIYIRQDKLADTIQTELEADGSTATRNHEGGRQLFGLRFGLSEDNRIYLEQHVSHLSLQFDNISYDRSEEHSNRELVLGIEYRKSLNFEFSMGKRKEENSFDDKTVTNSSSSFNHSNTQIGLTIRLQFSG